MTEFSDVGRYKRLLSHSKGMEAFPRKCYVVFAPGKNGYDFFQVEFPNGDMTV